MILSASRRTDIPAFHSKWFLDSLRKGEFCVVNPYNKHIIRKVEISPGKVDCIVFWTKNPEPLLNRLDELRMYNYYFLFTLNPYDNRIEKSVPQKDHIIEIFRKLSESAGKEKVIWRYDPLLVSDYIDIDYHIKSFGKIAEKLAGYTGRCIISFLDIYRKNAGILKKESIRTVFGEEIEKFCASIARIAPAFNITLQSCAEKYDLDRFGIIHGKCIDEKIIEKISGQKVEAIKDKRQRPECRCIESVDIGEYNTCGHNCIYCYANSCR
jgi:DNA repair photolyase